MSLLHKTRQQNKNNDPIIRLMAPMIAGILACVFCLVSMTWAWFTASVDTPPQTIQSANRSTSVVVYEVSQGEGENRKATKKLIKPKTTEEFSLAEDTQVAENEGTIIAGETAIWELLPEKTYEVVMTGSGTASTGYCEVELSHTASGSDTVETKLYKTSAFEKDDTVKFTYNTGGFSNPEGVTETEWKEYVEKSTPPTLAIASYWGKPAEEAEEQVSVMSLRDTSNAIMLLSDGDVLGLAPIPCPEAKAETEVELEGFEIQEGAEISAEEDYKVSLTLKEGYEMPSEVIVNIGGKDYVVSAGGADVNGEAPYYDGQTGVLTVPATLLSDGVKVSVKAAATPIPEEEPEKEQTEEVDEEETEETTENMEPEENPSADTPEDNVVDETPAKKEDEEEGELSVRPVKTPSGSGGKGNDNDGDDDEEDNDPGDSSTGDTSPDNNAEETEAEKADVKLNLSQLTINLEETKIPTNADLVLTLSAKEDMELPEEIAITLDKTIRDENTEDEEIQEDKTEYVINTNGKDNPEGFAFDTESGKLTISSELLKGVREITIADIEQSEETEGEKAEISFEVKNLTFDFTGDEIVTDEDVVIIFTAGEEYELPETIVITIDGEEYIVYTSAEASEPNPVGITFDAETGTLTISKELLEDVKAITITAEGVKKEEEESEEDSDEEGKEESEDTDNKENEGEGGGATGKDPENGDDESGDGDNTETEENPDVESGENDETAGTEPDPDDTTDGEDAGEGEPTEPDTEPEGGDSADGTGDAETGETGENDGGDAGEEKTEGTEPNPDAEDGDDSEETTPAAPELPAVPSEPAEAPESSKTDETEATQPIINENDGGAKGNTLGESQTFAALATSVQESSNTSGSAAQDKKPQDNMDSLPPENNKLEE